MFEAARRCLGILALLVIGFSILGVLGSIPLDTEELTATTPVTVSAFLEPDGMVGDFKLCVTAKIAKGLHIYSITQQPGGPNPTRLGIMETNDPTEVLSFIVTPMPVVTTSAVWPGLSIETHTGTVTWTYYIRFITKVKEKPTIRGFLQVSPCSETMCLMPRVLSFRAEVR